MEPKTTKEALDILSSEARELYLDKQVPVLMSSPSPLTFYRDYVAPNKPVIIQNALGHWEALHKWNSNYFREAGIGDVDVTVAVTPNGYADAITDGKFVMPEERRMTFADFLDILDDPDKHNGVFYVQKQNSNLTEEFGHIMGDVETDIGWGTEAFGDKPDAVNFWMGDQRAVTSMHRDHYENLYCVVRGWKTFILIPPTDIPYVPYEEYNSAVFKENAEGNFDIIDDTETGKVPWISIDPLKPDLTRYPEYAKACPVEVTVREGGILYLPSLWFHHVRQSHACIAVNYWYDMKYDIKYNYANLLKNLTAVQKHATKDLADTS